MALDRDLLLEALRDPAQLVSLPLAKWDLLIRQARTVDMVARLAIAIDDAGHLAAVPEPPRRHLESAMNLAAKHRRDILWEVRCLCLALSGLKIPLILLKGAAYVLADLPPSRGRLFRDVDMMVPRARLPEVERRLHQEGWLETKQDSYDQHYYRTWTHQLPPMIHYKRLIALDVHHTIVPLTARLELDPARLTEASRRLDAKADLRVLAPADMVLHSATHLFNEGEFSHGLRDLADLDALLRHFGQAPEFWAELINHAEQLDLRRPLFYAQRYMSSHLDTPIPAEVTAAAAGWAPPGPLLGLMDGLFLRALRPMHASCDDRWSGLARWLLFVRAHHLRMPPHILIPHLIRKAVTRRLDAWRGRPQAA